ncbi:MAG TPA: hypothetical protein VD962_01455 [Rubricoccaceae bacterium]|nr:hypothetical protein [Rubricoccaceae bacterium]
MRALLVLPALLLLSAACTNASIDEAYGVSGSTAWSYFDEPPQQVVDAIQRAFPSFGYQIEQVEPQADGGYILGLSTVEASGGFSEIRVMPTSESGFRTRVQTYPNGRRLSRDLEAGIRSAL